MPTITVGYDGSDVLVAALRWAASEAAHRGGTLRVLTCVTHQPEPITDRILPDPRPVYEMAEWLMQSQAPGRVRTRREFTLSVVQGPAEQRLVNESAGSDLLVIGSGGHLLLGAWRLGAIRTRSCVTPLVRSCSYRATTSRAGTHAWWSASRITRLTRPSPGRRSRPTVGVPNSSSSTPRRPDEAQEHNATEQASSVLAEAARVAAKHCDASINTRMVDGPPAPSLLAQAFNADMLVVGARAAGHGSDKPGSVARAVGACATRPTVIVQPNAVDTDPTGPTAR